MNIRTKDPEAEPDTTPNDHDWHEVGGKLSGSGAGEVVAVMVVGGLGVHNARENAPETG